MKKTVADYIGEAKKNLKAKYLTEKVLIEAFRLYKENKEDK